MQKDVTIYDIAQKLNISAATVSRALNDNPVINKNTRDKIQQVAKEMGYRHNTLASNLRKQQSNTIGILLHEVNSNFVTSVLAGIEKITTLEGYDLLIAHSAENGTREIANARNLLNKRVDGLIVSLALNTKNIDHFEPFFTRKIPVVFFDRVPRNTACTKVVIDNFKAGYEATSELIKQGCKKIAHITADLTRNVYNDRLEGYKAALKENNIAFTDDMVEICTLDKEDTIEAVNKLLAKQPDAFFITNDFAAAVGIEELHKKGIRVPEDIAVFGFNNDVLGSLITPKLSTIDYPGIEVGETAANELMQLMRSKQKKQVSKTVLVPSEMMVRESSNKKKKAP